MEKKKVQDFCKIFSRSSNEVYLPLKYEIVSLPTILLAGFPLFPDKCPVDVGDNFFIKLH